MNQQFTEDETKWPINVLVTILPSPEIVICLCHSLILICLCHRECQIPLSASLWSMGHKQSYHKQNMKYPWPVGFALLRSWFWCKKRTTRCLTGPRRIRDTWNRCGSMGRNPEAEPYQLACRPQKINDCL